MSSGVEPQALFGSIPCPLTHCLPDFSQLMLCTRARWGSSGSRLERPPLTRLGFARSPRSGLGSLPLPWAVVR